MKTERNKNYCLHTAGAACCGDCQGAATPFCAYCGASSEKLQEKYASSKAWMPGEEPLIK